MSIIMKYLDGRKNAGRNEHHYEIFRRKNEGRNEYHYEKFRRRGGKMKEGMVRIKKGRKEGIKVKQ